MTRKQMVQVEVGGLRVPMAALRPRLIDITKFPPYFLDDSFERGIFKPETDTHATPDQIRSLLSDAEFYCDPHGPDACPDGLKTSARAVIRHCRRALQPADCGRSHPQPYCTCLLCDPDWCRRLK